MSTGAERALRTCLGCREVLEKKHLLRYVVSPQGDLLVDYQGRLPGRGAYTCFSRSCLDRAVKRGQFRRAFKRELGVPDGDRLWEDLSRQVERRVVGLIGMARKSGVLVLGSSQVLESLGGTEAPALVLQAEDMSEAIASKIQWSAGKAAATLYKVFSKEQLGNMLGRGAVSVVGLRQCPLADALKKELARYQQITEGL